MNLRGKTKDNKDVMLNVLADNLQSNKFERVAFEEMNLTRCEFNHYYDADKYSESPHCKKEVAISKNEKSNGGEIAKDEEMSLPISEKDDWNFSLFGEET